MSSPPNPPSGGKPTASSAAEFVLQPEWFAVQVAGRQITLTKTQFQLLAVLVGEPGRTFSRAELAERGLGRRVTPRSVDSHISEIRRKLGPQHWRIETVPRHGYRYHAATAAPPPKRVVFIGVENSSRSQMAEAFARLYSGEQLEAYSAGTRPAATLDSKAILVMSDLGCDLVPHHPKGVAELPDVEFDVAVTIGGGDPGPSLRARRRESWKVPDPSAMRPEEFRTVRDLIADRVKELLARL